jgi:diguanylate cyclase (GGDEF)-like protein
MQTLKKKSSALVTMLLHLNNLGEIVHTLGRSAGDTVIEEVTHLLKAVLHPMNKIICIGEDEFLILLSGVGFSEGARLAQKLRHAVADFSIVLNKKRVKVSVGLGVLAAAGAASLVEELLGETRTALSIAEEKKSRPIYLRKRPTVDGARRNPVPSIFSALHSEKNPFSAVKQPIFSLADQKKIGYEFLSRTSIEGLEMPDDFFRHCLESHILTPIDHECLKVCIEAASRLEEKGRRHFNLFPSTLMEIPVQILSETFSKYGRREVLCIEISEQQIISDPSYLIPPIQRLKREGILIAIDDVGFGCSSVESLIELEPNIVKVDRKWINGIAGDFTQQQSMKRLLGIANVLEAEVVAEGIETEEDLKALIDLGVSYGQGYYWGKPA